MEDDSQKVYLRILQYGMQSQSQIGMKTGIWDDSRLKLTLDKLVSKGLIEVMPKRSEDSNALRIYRPNLKTSQ